MTFATIAISGILESATVLTIENGTAELYIWDKLAEQSGVEALIGKPVVVTGRIELVDKNIKINVNSIAQVSQKAQISDITILGRMGRDPEIKINDKGTTITGFSLAVNNRDKSTSWYNLTAFNKTGEVIGNYVKKGHYLGINGTLSIEAYTSKDGEERTAIKIIANNAFLMSRKFNEGGESTEQQEQPKQQKKVKPVAEAEIPF